MASPSSPPDQRKAEPCKAEDGPGVIFNCIDYSLSGRGREHDGYVFPTSVGQYM